MSRGNLGAATNARLGQINAQVDTGQAAETRNFWNQVTAKDYQPIAAMGPVSTARKTAGTGFFS